MPVQPFAAVPQDLTLPRTATLEGHSVSPGKWLVGRVHLTSGESNVCIRLGLAPRSPWALVATGRNVVIRYRLIVDGSMMQQSLGL